MLQGNQRHYDFKRGTGNNPASEQSSLRVNESSTISQRPTRKRRGIQVNRDKRSIKNVSTQTQWPKNDFPTPTEENKPKHREETTTYPHDNSPSRESKSPLDQSSGFTRPGNKQPTPSGRRGSSYDEKTLQMNGNAKPSTHDYSRPRSPSPPPTKRQDPASSSRDESKQPEIQRKREDDDSRSSPSNRAQLDNNDPRRKGSLNDYYRAPERERSRFDQQNMSRDRDDRRARSESRTRTPSPTKRESPDRTRRSPVKRQPEARDYSRRDRRDSPEPHRSSGVSRSPKRDRYDDRRDRDQSPSRSVGAAEPKRQSPNRFHRSPAKRHPAETAYDRRDRSDSPEDYRSPPRSRSPERGRQDRYDANREHDPPRSRTRTSSPSKKKSPAKSDRSPVKRQPEARDYDRRDRRDSPERHRSSGISRSPERGRYDDRRDRDQSRSRSHEAVPKRQSPDRSRRSPEKRQPIQPTSSRPQDPEYDRHGRSDSRQDYRSPTRSRSPERGRQDRRDDGHERDGHRTRSRTPSPPKRQPAPPSSSRPREPSYDRSESRHRRDDLQPKPSSVSPSRSQHEVLKKEEKYSPIIPPDDTRQRHHREVDSNRDSLTILVNIGLQSDLNQVASGYDVRSVQRTAIGPTTDRREHHRPAESPIQASSSEVPKPGRSTDKYEHIQRTRIGSSNGTDSPSTSKQYRLRPGDSGSPYHVSPRDPSPSGPKPRPADQQVHEPVRQRAEFNDKERVQQRPASISRQSHHFSDLAEQEQIEPSNIIRVEPSRASRTGSRTERHPSGLADDRLPVDHRLDYHTPKRPAPLHHGEEKRLSPSINKDFARPFEGYPPVERNRTFQPVHSDESPNGKVLLLPVINTSRTYMFQPTSPNQLTELHQSKSNGNFYLAKRSSE